VLLDIIKIGYYFTKRVPGGVSWALQTTRKLLLAIGKIEVEPSCSK
jgi:hypothetical protein